MDDAGVLATLKDFNFSLSAEQYKVPTEESVTQFIVEFLEHLGYNTKKLITVSL